MLVLIPSGTVRDLARRVGNEAKGPDLDERDLLERMGLAYEAVADGERLSRGAASRG